MKPPKQEVTVSNRLREINLVTLNHSVSITSSYKSDSLDKLSQRALDLLSIIKTLDKGGD